MPAVSLAESLTGAISASQVARLCDVHIATVHRWWSPTGVRGVRLPSWLRGGKRVTTRAALDQFLRELNSDRPEPKSDSDAATARRSAEAEQALISLGS